MRDDIVVIGPVAAGKTTVSALLAEALGVPHVRMDSLREGYYAEIGYDPAVRDRLLEAEGPAAVYRYWKVFDPHSVERMLAEHRGILDMGGGSLMCEHDDQLERMRRALEPFPNVVLLMPDPDPQASLRILDERTGWGGRERNINRHFVTHRSLWELGKIHVFTGNRGPEEARDLILDRIGI